MGEMNVGKVRPVFCGEYVATVSCGYYECYKYGGTWWLHIGTAPTTGTAPSEGTVWTAFGVKGDAGANGAPGSAATIAIGTVTTGVAGSAAAIVNSGTSDAAIFDITIPKGDKGDKGDNGISGTDGVSITAVTINSTGDLIVTTSA